MTGLREVLFTPGVRPQKDGARLDSITEWRAVKASEAYAGQR